MQLNKQRDARKEFPGIRHPLLLSFLAGKLAFKHIYEDDDSLYEAIKSTPVFANILLEDDSVFVLYSALMGFRAPPPLGSQFRFLTSDVDFRQGGVRKLTSERGRYEIRRQHTESGELHLVPSGVDKLIRYVIAYIFGIRY